MRAQPRVPGGRRGLSAGVLRRIREAVEREAARYDCSMSFVVATVLAHHFGIDEQSDYVDGAVTRLRRRRA